MISGSRPWTQTSDQVGSFQNFGDEGEEEGRRGRLGPSRLVRVCKVVTATRAQALTALGRWRDVVLLLDLLTV